MVKRKPVNDYIRSAFFGMEDSLVSTSGFIAGVISVTNDRNLILFTGVIAIAVEAFSMAAGEFLSEETTQDLSRRKTSQPIIGGVIMLTSYVFAGLIPLLPAVLLPASVAFVGSVCCALIGLFALGYAKGKVTHRPAIKSAMKVLIIGGLAAVIGILVANVLQPNKK